MICTELQNLVSIFISRGLIIYLFIFIYKYCNHPFLFLDLYFVSTFIKLIKCDEQFEIVWDVDASKLMIYTRMWYGNYSELTYADCWGARTVAGTVSPRCVALGPVPDMSNNQKQVPSAPPQQSRCYPQQPPYPYQTFHNSNTNKPFKMGKICS